MLRGGHAAHGRGSGSRRSERDGVVTGRGGGEVDGAILCSRVRRSVTSSRVASDVLAPWPCSRTSLYAPPVQAAAAFPSRSLRTGLDGPFGTSCFAHGRS